ncbi:MAG TPA: hypothetical protein H9774_04330 [Candidatus Desulfovibrio gallistercoris]|nr:hypothetical protein [Candidatus Desulfovibrio gallistercoris]
MAALALPSDVAFSPIAGTALHRRLVLPLPAIASAVWSALSLQKAKCEAAEQRRPAKIERGKHVFSAKRQAVCMG